MSIGYESSSRSGHTSFGRWEAAILDVLVSLRRPCNAQTVTARASAELWPPHSSDTHEGESLQPAGHQLIRLLDRLAVNGHIRRWEPGERYPCDLWTIAGWRWEATDSAMYATAENARRWESSAERTEAEHLRARHVVQRLTRLTGWQRVCAPAAEPTLVSLQLTVTEAEELLAAYAATVKDQPGPR
jgi:hypothetical protein